MGFGGMCCGFFRFYFLVLHKSVVFVFGFVPVAGGLFWFGRWVGYLMVVLDLWIRALVPLMISFLQHALSPSHSKFDRLLLCLLAVVCQSSLSPSLPLHPCLCFRDLFPIRLITRSCCVRPEREADSARDRKQVRAPSIH